MDNQRIRNLTTGRLHTSMADVVADISELLGIQLLDTQCPDANDAFWWRFSFF
jgi:hypothetical protein